MSSVICKTEKNGKDEASAVKKYLVLTYFKYKTYVTYVSHLSYM